MQPAELKGLQDEILLTLAGIHILQNAFPEKKNCWALVVAKAINAMAAKQGVTKQQVQVMADQVQV